MKLSQTVSLTQPAVMISGGKSLKCLTIYDKEDYSAVSFFVENDKFDEFVDLLISSLKEGPRDGKLY